MVEGRGVGTLNKDEGLLKTKDLSKKWCTLPWSRGAEEEEETTKAWTPLSCRWLFPGLVLEWEKQSPQPSC